MPKRNQRRYACLDCGAMLFLWPDRGGLYRRTRRERCRECGSTCLDVSSIQADKDQVAAHKRAATQTTERGDLVRAKGV